MLCIDFCLMRSLSLVTLLLGCGVSAYTALPRWGQATAVINDALFVHGGKTDQFNSYSYTSAPSNNDLLLLSLSSSFVLSSPPWQLVSSSTNTSTSQGPALAWHTLSAYNTSGILLFGGQPNPNSPTVLPAGADSAALLDVYNRLQPSWTIEPTSWAGQPMRRIHHSTATTVNGLIYIIGGEKADGSNNALSDHYIFNTNGNGPSFAQLSNANGPPDIFGHTSIILPTGQLLVFGGYCQSEGSLVPFSTIWAIDTTQPSAAWTTLTVSSGTLPAPRRAFASVLLDGSKILVHGGADATLQTTYSDGWILDSSQNPLVWTKIDALSQIGARRDHFAVAVGSQVIFGFGYGSDSAAPADLQIYDISSSAFISSFTPPPPTSTATTQTLPGPSKTNDSPSHSDGSSGHDSGSSGGSHPSSTKDPGTGQNGNSGHDTETKSGSKKAIALGTVFGVLGLIAGVVIVVYFARRRDQRRVGDAKFKTLRDGEDGDGGNSPHLEGAIPAAGALIFRDQSSAGRKGGMSAGWILNSLGIARLVGATGQRSAARRDMLADEDTRDFGPWYDYERRMMDGSGGSSWSLRTILGGMGMRSREASMSGHLSAVGGSRGSHWREKTDPFSDGVAMMKDEPRAGSEVFGGAVRPPERRQASYASTMSRRSYVDPFADPIQEEPREGYRHDLEDREGSEVHDLLPSYPYPTLSTPPLQVIAPLATGTHTLSPLAEQASHNTLAPSDPPSSVSSHTISHERALSPFDKSALTSVTSLDPSRSAGPRTSSIVDANLPPTQPMRRSDSWWARFSRTSFLDRRTSDPSKRSRPGGMFDIRDPNPPPRLLAIEESTHSVSPEQDSPKSHHSNTPGRGQSLSRRGSRVYYGEHRKSASSLQTSRTADSEAIERMAGMMDVVRVGSQRTRDSSDNSISIDTHVGSADWGIDKVEGKDGELMTFTSPVEMTQGERDSLILPHPNSASSTTSPVSSPSVIQPPSPASWAPSLAKDGRKGPPRPLSGGAVASRVQAYERRMSQDREVPSPTNTRQWEERTRKKSHGTTVNYGLVPRPSLYVANPDHGAKPSGDS